MIYYIISFIVLTVSLLADDKSIHLEQHKIKLSNVYTLLQQHVSEFEIPGIAVAIYYDGQEYFFANGLANIEKNIAVTPDTLFKLASITKVFTSTLLSIQVIDGKMKLTDSVVKFLPIHGNHPTSQGIEKVTLINLATHTSSLPRVFPNLNHGVNYSEEKIFNFLKNWQPSYDIATRYFYSNLGFGLLGIILSHESGLSYIDLLKAKVLSPLNMTHTFIDVPNELKHLVAVGYTKDGKAVLPTPVNHLTPGSGALYSTAKDMLKFLKANLGLDGPKYLMQAMEYAEQEFFIVNPKLSIGLGWQRFKTANDLLIIDKNGGLPGFSSYIGFTKTPKKAGIVILTNKHRVQDTELGRKILIQLNN